MQSGLRAQAFRAQNVACAWFSSSFSLFSSHPAALGRCRTLPARAPLSKSGRDNHPRPISTKACSLLHELAKVSEGPQPLVFESSSVNPYHNLSIEDYLLRNSHHSSRILFFYTNRPCVVIGRNQNPWLECNLRRLRDGLRDGEVDDGQHTQVASSGKTEAVPIDLVRRRSGGGTVFHDLGNLNYSVIVPNDKDFNRHKHAEMVVRALNKVTDHDFSAKLKVNKRHDIVMQKHGQDEWLKISGSAFKLTKGRALHHGTLLYSSQHLRQISGLLRSPGRDYIHAKGVESVRSKIGNLTWIGSRTARDRLRAAIIDKVTVEFLTLYGNGPTSISRTSPVQVSDEDCRGESNATIATGVRELMTNEWRFGQTPRFDFDSGTIDGLQVQFHANRGVVEAVKIHSVGSVGQSEAEGTSGNQSHLHSIDDWKTVLADLRPTAKVATPGYSNLKELSQKIVQNVTLMQRIESSFPCFH